MNWRVVWIVMAWVLCLMNPTWAEISETPFSVGQPLLISLHDGASQTQVSIPSINLFDQHNKTRNITELIKGRTVVIDFIFTSCKTSCSILSAIMARVEGQLSEYLGNTITLISLSVDPTHDRPAQLQAFSKKMGAGEHWHWLTGNVSEVKQMLRAFGVPVDGRPQDHPPIVMAGNTTTGKWRRWVGIPDPNAVVDTAIALSLDQ